MSTKGNYLSLYYHIVFSTKGRKLLIYPEIQKRLDAYIQKCSKEGVYSVINVNGTRDHIHILLTVYSSDFILSHFVREIKKSTNKFLNSEGNMDANFSWQEGYFASTVSRRDVDAIRLYIERQKEHHGKFDFDKELAIIFGLNE